MIRIAFAGFRHGHIYVLYDMAKKNPNIEITAAWEEDESARSAAKKELGVRFTHNSYDSLLEDKNIDVIAIGDYYGRRGSLAIKALKAGKHVYADKPLCISQDELDEIERLAREKNLKVGLMLDMRQNKFVKPVYDLLKTGKLGKIQNIFFSGQHPLMYGSRPSWYFEEGKHGGTINDIAIHGIDMVSYLTGLTLKRVLCVRCWNAYAKEVPSFKDSAQFMIELTNGAGLMADVSYAAPDSSGYTLPFYWRFTIWGTDGAVEFGSNLNEIIVALNGEKSFNTISVSDEETKDCLSLFLDELKSNPVDINTETVIKASRDTLTIQEFSNR